MFFKRLAKILSDTTASREVTLTIIEDGTFIVTVSIDGKDYTSEDIELDREDYEVMRSIFKKIHERAPRTTTIKEKYLATEIIIKLPYRI